MLYFRYVFATVLILAAIDTSRSDDKACPTLRHSKNITISNILGTWYVVRGIEHTELQSTHRPGTNKDCNSMSINQNNQYEIELQWNKNNVVKFQINNHNPNLWENTSNLASNAMSMRTLQVTEVDENHIVITICSPSKRLSSAVLHREATFNQQQVSSATNKLTEQNLKIIKTFDRCQTVT